MTLDDRIRQARTILDRAIVDHKPVAVYAAFSGGDDSIVSTHFTMTHVPGAQVLHVETGTGLRPTREHAEACARRLGWDMRVERTPESYEALVLGRAKGYPGGFPGRRMHGLMYQRLKERAFRAAVRDAKAGQDRRSRVLIVSGIRHDESDARSGYKRTESKVGSQVWLNPFYWATAADFAAYRQAFGLPANPIKPVVGISGECGCGCFACPFERHQARKVDREWSAWMDDLDNRVRAAGYPWGWEDQPPRWFLQKCQGQGFLFDLMPGPACYGCGKGDPKPDAATPPFDGAAP
jgi:3'-phosphoadenosine 5'-phosphosulfate sulfotransferase (PAPS reductase)/FAD synthetase